MAYPTNKQIFKYLDEVPVDILAIEYNLINEKKSKLSSMVRKMVIWKVNNLIQNGIIKANGVPTQSGQA